MMFQSLYFCIVIAAFFGTLIPSYFVYGSLFQTIENKKVQKFYFNDPWNDCFAFVYNGTTEHKRFYDSPYDCQHMLWQDVACSGPNSSISPVYSRYPDRGCRNAKCPDGYSCVTTEYSTCCNDEITISHNDAHADTCPDGSQAKRSWKYGYFYSVFGETCNDLICDENEKCVQINKYFAKCCETSPLHRPLFSGTLKHWSRIF